MFIPANKIIELIEIAHECDRKLPEEEKKIHVLDIAATLQKLIDDEEARLDKLADQWDDNEWEEIGLEGLERGSEEIVSQELEVDFNWPHGV